MSDPSPPFAAIVSIFAIEWLLVAALLKAQSLLLAARAREAQAPLLAENQRLREAVADDNEMLERIWADLDVIEETLARGDMESARAEMARLQDYCSGIDEASAADERWRQREAA